MNAKRSTLQFLTQLTALLGIVGGAALAPRQNARAQALERESEDFRVLFKQLTNSARVTQERVHVTIPRLADNGHSVPLKVWVDSPQSAEDHVKRLVVLSERNPRPICIAFIHYFLNLSI